MTVQPVDLTAYQEGDPTAHLAAATQAVQDYCGWHIAPSRTTTVTLVPTASDTLMLPSMYVTDVASVVVRDTALPVEEYSWTEHGVVTRRPGWYVVDPVLDGVTVTFTHGYVDFPANVLQVIVALAQRSIDNPSGRTRSDVPGTLSDVFAVVGAIPMTGYDKDNLAAYRIPGMA